MVRIKKIYIILFFYPCCIFSQSINEKYNELIFYSNKYFSENKVGSIKYIWKAKPLLTNKEYRSKVHLFYNKNLNNQDSLSSFILIIGDKYYQILYDNQLYITDTINKVIKCYSVDTISNATLEKLVNKHCLRLFKPYIRTTNDPISKITYYKSIIEEKFVNLNLVSSMTLVDSNEIHKYDSTEIIFSNFNYSILKYQRISYDREALDIQKYIFDSIQNDSNVIQDIGGFIDSLISKGYKLEYQNPFLDLVSPTTIIDTFKYAPEFILSDYKKNIFDLSKSKSKLLLIDFSYLSCLYCLKSVPFLNKLYEQYSRDKLDLLWVDAFDSKNKDYADSIFNKRKFLFPVYYDEDHSVTKSYNVNIFPTIYIIELPSKKIIGKFQGYTIDNERMISELIDKAIR